MANNITASQLTKLLNMKSGTGDYYFDKDKNGKLSAAELNNVNDELRGRGSGKGNLILEEVFNSSGSSGADTVTLSQAKDIFNNLAGDFNEIAGKGGDKKQIEAADLRSTSGNNSSGGSGSGAASDYGFKHLTTEKAEQILKAVSTETSTEQQPSDTSGTGVDTVEVIKSQATVQQLKDLQTYLNLSNADRISSELFSSQNERKKIDDLIDASSSEADLKATVKELLDSQVSDPEAVVNPESVNKAILEKEAVEELANNENGVEGLLLGTPEQMKAIVDLVGKQKKTWGISHGPVLIEKSRLEDLQKKLDEAVRSGKNSDLVGYQDKILEFTGDGTFDGVPELKAIVEDMLDKYDQLDTAQKPGTTKDEDVSAEDVMAAASLTEQAKEVLGVTEDSSGGSDESTIASQDQLEANRAQALSGKDTPSQRTDDKPVVAQVPAGQTVKDDRLYNPDIDDNDVLLNEGDCLWNLVKRYCPGIDPNDIAEKVSILAKANGIDDPDLISANTRLNVSCLLEDKQEKKTPPGFTD